MHSVTPNTSLKKLPKVNIFIIKDIPKDKNYK